MQNLIRMGILQNILNSLSGPSGPFSASFNSSPMSMVQQPDGKIVIVGFFSTPTVRIIRLEYDGSTDATFNMGSSFNNVPNTIGIQSDGKFIVGGLFTTYQGVTANRIVRLNSDGSRDTSFDIGTGFNDRVLNRIINIDNDGKMLVAGLFTTYQGVTVNRIIRLNSNGSRDTSFNMGSGFNGLTTSSVQFGDRIIVTGQFTTYNGQSANNIVGLNLNGSRDTSFDIGTGFNAILDRARFQSDGKIIASGNFTTYQGVSANRIIRLNTDGSRDTSFDIGSGFNNRPLMIKIQPDGKIILAGLFTTYQGVSANRIVRLNSDGSRDTSFDIGTGFNSVVNGIQLQQDNKILAGGEFTSYNNISASRIIRLNTDGSPDIP